MEILASPLLFTFLGWTLSLSAHKDAFDLDNSTQYSSICDNDGIATRFRSSSASVESPSVFNTPVAETIRLTSAGRLAGNCTTRFLLPTTTKCDAICVAMRLKSPNGVLDVKFWPSLASKWLISIGLKSIRRTCISGRELNMTILRTAVYTAIEAQEGCSLNISVEANCSGNDPSKVAASNNDPYRIPKKTSDTSDTATAIGPTVFLLVLGCIVLVWLLFGVIMSL